MTQQLHDEQVDPLEYPDTVKSDLLSLRAAVRRVLEANANYKEEVSECHGVESSLSVLLGIVLLRRVDELRAEMAGIDGGSNKEQKL